ncbi:MAG: serine protease [Acidobacteriota bacterium]|nr:serine protease [Acidobacteriota bacterium]
MNVRDAARSRTISELAALATPDVVLPAALQRGASPFPQGVAWVGVVRPLVLTAAATATQHRTVVQSSGAERVRLKLARVSLAPGATLAVYGTSGPAVVFGAELLDGGELWTPSVEGDTIAVQVESGAASFEVAAAGHVFADPAVTGTECFTDVMCSAFSDRESLSKSIAQITFATSEGLAACTGGLINSDDQAPLFLTANHCVSTTSEAASVEASWDATTASCAGTRRSPTRTNGAKLLVTSAGTDVTLLRMTSTPAGRWLMGWSTQTLAAGTRLTRISNPVNPAGGFFPQVYSVTTVDTASATCSGASRPHFLYSRRQTGGIRGGSSGAPVIIDGGYIVGQLLGTCGADDGCASNGTIVDGALSQSYPLLRAYIDADSTPPPCTACVPNSTTACLLGNRFKVTGTWFDPFINLRGDAHPIRFTENRPEISPEHGPVLETAFFSFFDFFPNTVETMVKMTKGVGINNKYWVFVTGLSGAEYTLRVQDTRTCQVWQKVVPASSTTLVRDFEAFPFP